MHISCGTVLVNTIRDCPSTVISSRNIVLSKP
uniref:PanC-beta-alanine ligase n=1 Tax=Siphoviridae sp. ctCCX1 TaxID=2823567 RepID=A0A8S5LDF2_9CAUD|nr:MAG TPA: PanC-beta-alanine ligase [Siphoviridae sp. ctCCX1]